MSKDVAVEGGVRFAIFVDDVKMKDWTAAQIAAFFDGLAAAVKAASEPQP